MSPIATKKQEISYYQRIKWFAGTTGVILIAITLALIVLNGLTGQPLLYKRLIAFGPLVTAPPGFASLLVWTTYRQKELKAKREKTALECKLYAPIPNEQLRRYFFPKLAPLPP